MRTRTTPPSRPAPFAKSARCRATELSARLPVTSTDREDAAKRHIEAMFSKTGNDGAGTRDAP